jgi:hypothetical protein
LGTLEFASDPGEGFSQPIAFFGDGRDLCVVLPPNFIQLRISEFQSPQRLGMIKLEISVTAYDVIVFRLLCLTKSKALSILSRKGLDCVI